MSYLYKNTQINDFAIKFIHVHVDKLVLFFPFEPLDSLFTALSEAFGTPKDQWLWRSHRRQQVYEQGKDKLSLVYTQNGHCLMTLHDPHGEFQEKVKKVLWSLEIEPFVTNIELAWDFYSKENHRLKEFLDRHIVILYARTAPITYDNTYYPSEIRGKVKGVRIYGRPKFSRKKKFIRLELVLNRKKIKELNITFPITPDQLDLDFNKFFRFQRFDKDKFYRYLVRQESTKVRELYTPKSNKLLHPIKRKRAELYKRVVASWVEWFADHKMMTVINRLKEPFYKTKSYHRFFIPLDDWNRLIKDEAERQQFCLDTSLHDYMLAFIEADAASIYEESDFE
ncbi:hypothetical protein ACFL0B_04985 [Thermodesulfobacteriota bacterium]